MLLTKNWNKKVNLDFQNALKQEIRSAAAKHGNADYLAMWSGQNPRMSRDIAAGELIRQLAEQVETLIEKLK